MRRFFAVWLSLGVSACGGSPPPSPVAAPRPKPVAAPLPAKPSDVLHRSEVLALLDAGFGRFLQRIEVEPSLDAGRFRGWTIVELRPATFWESVDLKPGDVVTSVNGLPIERETEAWGAFESLRTANEISVAYQRGAAARGIRYRIVD